jgi:branched-chain amino acid transport system substrate-binding protein
MAAEEGGNIMKMKKLVSLLMVAALSASMLTGCGSSNDAAGSSDAATDATTDAAAEGTENAAGGTLKIGGIGPLTGSAAVYGTAVANAAQLAVDEVNAAGGVNGVQLELNFQDDECDAEKSVNAYNTLKDWGMQMLVQADAVSQSVSTAKMTTCSS